MSSTKRKILLLNVMFIVSTVIIYAQKPAALEAFLQNRVLSHAAVSFKAVDLSNGQTIAAFNEKMAVIPASNMKIVTTATALDTLGAGFRYQTALSYDGAVKDGVLDGNLYLTGSGDPTLGSEYMTGDPEDFLWDCLTALRKAGIKSIEGDIVVLDQLFGYEGVSPYWMLEDLNTYYAPGAYGISIFDNIYRIHIQTGKPGTRAAIRSISPEIPGLHLKNELKAAKTGGDRSRISGAAASLEKRLAGTIPANRNEYIIRSTIPDPGMLLADYFYKFLEKNDILIKGEATTFRITRKLPHNETTIAVLQSPRLAAIARETNVESNNHYAEHLYKKLLTLDSLDVSGYWERRGLDGSSLLMIDGSGLAASNAVTADFLTGILMYMYQKDGTTGAFYQSLPVSGQDGTVAKFLKNTPLEGKVHLKSGSITHVQAYSGYVEKEENIYAFSLIVNYFSGGRSDLRTAMEELLVGLF